MTPFPGLSLALSADRTSLFPLSVSSPPNRPEESGARDRRALSLSLFAAAPRRYEGVTRYAATGGCLSFLFPPFFLPFPLLSPNSRTLNGEEEAESNGRSRSRLFLDDVAIASSASPRVIKGERRNREGEERAESLRWLAGPRSVWPDDRAPKLGYPPLSLRSACCFRLDDRTFLSFPFKSRPSLGGVKKNHRHGKQDEA